MAKVLEAPALHACYRYYDLLDYDKMNSALGTDWKYDPYNGTLVRQIQNDLTIANILQFTPSSDEALGACSVRHPNSYIINPESSKDCHKMFSIIKYVVLEYICYKYRYVAVENQTFSLLELANTPVSPGLMYEVNPSDPFKKFRLAKFIATGYKVYPYKAMGQTQLMDRFGRPDDDLGIYSLTYFTLITKRLPPPFVTMCYNYSDMDRQSQTDCHQRCVKKFTEESLNKIPFSSIETEAKNQSVLSYLDVTNETIAQMLFKYYNDCDNYCRKKDCRERSTFSRVLVQPKNYFLIRIGTPVEPSVTVSYKPIIQFPEYLTYLLSCFGTWFGLSVISLFQMSTKTKVILHQIKLMKSSVTDAQTSPAPVRSVIPSEDDLRRDVRLLKFKIESVERLLSSRSPINATSLGNTNCTTQASVHKK